MKCPTCPDTLLAMSSRNSVEIDYCPKCRGVWLDRGELDKILEKVQEENASSVEAAPVAQTQQNLPPHAYPHQPPFGGGYYKYKRKKSFLEELFD